MLFHVELKETRTTYATVEVEASNADDALAIASELYEIGDGDSRSRTGQLGRLYVDIVNIVED
jgi:hypothetical protein